MLFEKLKEILILKLKGYQAQSKVGEEISIKYSEFLAKDVLDAVKPNYIRDEVNLFISKITMIFTTGVIFYSTEGKIVLTKKALDNIDIDEAITILSEINSNGTFDVLNEEKPSHVQNKSIDYDKQLAKALDFGVIDAKFAEWLKENKPSHLELLLTDDGLALLQSRVLKIEQAAQLSLSLLKTCVNTSKKIREGSIIEVDNEIIDIGAIQIAFEQKLKAEKKAKLEVELKAEGEKKEFLKFYYAELVAKKINNGDFDVEKFIKELEKEKVDISLDEILSLANDINKNKLEEMQTRHKRLS